MPPKPELLGFPSRKDLRPPLPAGPGAADLAQLQVGDGAGVNEGLSDDGEAGVDVVRLVDVEDKLGVFQDVHPEPERKAVGWGRGRRGEPTPRVCSKGSGRWGRGSQEGGSQALRTGWLYPSRPERLRLKREPQFARPRRGLTTTPASWGGRGAKSRGCPVQQGRMLGPSYLHTGPQPPRSLLLSRQSLKPGPGSH